MKLNMWEEILEQPKALRACFEKNIATAAELAALARKRGIRSIVIAARGTSDHAGIYGRYMIEALTGIPVSMAAPSIATMYGAKIDFSDSLVIGISQSGEAADVLAVLESARRCGALTAGITNNSESPIAKMADLHLDCSAGPEKSVAATKTFTTEMLLLAMLAGEYAQNETLLKKLATEMPDGVEKTIKLFKKDIDKVQRYTFIDECFVLARGINYAICLEAALKIQETTYVRAKAFAVSDFYHGPIAMADKKIPVIIYAPKGPSMANMAELAEKMRELEIETVMITNDSDAAEKATTSFMIADGDDDMITPFYNAAAAQMFACKLSQAKGLNPDAPRMLKKVTITV